MTAVRSIPVYRPMWKLGAVCLIAAMGIIAGIFIRRIAGIESSARSIDWTAYDKLFRCRPTEDRSAGPIVLIAIDDWSLSLMQKYLGYGWPWPRESYAKLIDAANEGGARAIVFDITFDAPSVYDAESEDSKSLAVAVSKTKIPIIFGVQTSDDVHAPPAFALPIAKPCLGAVNLPSDSFVLRSYPLYFNNTPTLALRVAALLNPRLSHFGSDEPFLLHYYGRFGSVEAKDPQLRPTHRRVSFADVLLPRCGCSGADIHPVQPAAFKDKILVVGTVAHGLYDDKASPYSARYPGFDYHATAIENLLESSRVLLAGRGVEALALAIPALLAAAATIFLRGTAFKLGIPLVVATVVILVIYRMFLASPIIFLAPTGPLSALGVSTLLGLTWSYFTEGRQRAFLSRAFSQYVSRAVVDELERNPAALNLGGRRKTVTILFSDIRSFTTISEKMQPEQIEKFMNAYLGAMTDVVLAEKGTVDKYIGDAVMAFWNAPLDQSDHPACAARAAVRMLAREREMQGVLRELTGEEIYTRIGIATGEVTVGNFGSAEKINYTVLGDSVNLASRLEGANKIYGSQILMAEPAALAAKDTVLIRRLGLLCVKGKTQAMAVYEALGELPGTTDQQFRKERYELAFDAYLARDWNQAEQHLAQLLISHPHDRPAEKLLEAVREFRAAPPTENWDGVYTAHEK